MKTKEKKNKKHKEHLAHFDIAGFTYYEGVEAIEDLKIGTPLEAVLDEENKYDARAVALYHKDHKLGFIPRSENRIFYKLLKTNVKNMQLRVQRVSKDTDPEHQVAVVAHLIKQ